MLVGMSSLLVHLCGSGEWARAQIRGAIEPAHGSAFVHLSTTHQVHLPANRVFSGRKDLMLLYVDPALLHAALRWEVGVPGDPATMVFPHLYGPLPVSAVIKVNAYPPGADGRFAPLPVP